MKVLVISPHPDDETLCCGGTIINLKKKGYEVRIIIVTDGRYGAPKDELKGTKELIEIRRKEALRAVKKLGVDDIIFLDFEDSKVNEKNTEIENSIRAILRDYKPDITFSPIPLDNHPDHAGLGKIMLKLAPSSYFYLIWMPEKLRLEGWDEIKFDIREYRQLKIEAIMEYKSQLGGFSEEFLKRLTGEYEIFYKRII
ncbi:PIG-L family deacetylase [Sulfolobus tengchongensis]|uniref:PIG-L family deacetylase n=1 Tax=Sulfolobus tengchongensis TaxID=207809 RepID=A0AAX4L3V0_9CREN